MSIRFILLCTSSFSASDSFCLLCIFAAWPFVGINITAFTYQKNSTRFSSEFLLEKYRFMDLKDIYFSTTFNTVYSCEFYGFSRYENSSLVFQLLSFSAFLQKCFEVTSLFGSLELYAFLWQGLLYIPGCLTCEHAFWSQFNYFLSFFIFFSFYLIMFDHIIILINPMSVAF